MGGKGEGEITYLRDVCVIRRMCVGVSERVC